MDISSNVLNLPVKNDASKTYQNYSNIQGLNDLKQQAREDQRSALKPVAEQFEAMFVQQVFKEARKVSFDDGWLDGNQGDFYKDWHDKQLSQDLAAKGTLGFADKIVEDLLPSLPVTQNAKEASTESGQEPSLKALNNTQHYPQQGELKEVSINAQQNIKLKELDLQASTESNLKLRNIK
ncbi:hypothetical protein JCM30760_08280 [Thiomicrorhabdus hydrogeniphila]